MRRIEIEPEFISRHKELSSGQKRYIEMALDELATIADPVIGSHHLTRKLYEKLLAANP